MTAEDVRAFFDALGRGDVAAIEVRLAEDVVLEFPGRRFGGRFEGRRRVVVFLRQNQRLFREGLRFTVAWVGVCGDRAVAQWTNEGVTRDGKNYANRGATVFREAGDRVVEIQDYLDTERLSETWPA
jgi:ketosteroid isomerase-like protein